MKPKKIECPNCNTWLASHKAVRGNGYLLLWCKRCKKEICIDLKELDEQAETLPRKQANET